MLDFEKLNGFYVALSNRALVLMELENVLSDETDRADLIEENTISGLRNFIIEYYTSNYDTIICIKPNVYFIVKEDLYTDNDIEKATKHLRDRIEEGFEYAMSKDNEIEELKENINELQLEKNVLQAKITKIMNEIKKLGE